MSFSSHRQHDRVKLHVTVLNSLYRNKLEDEFEGYKEGAPRVKMDARCVHCSEYYFFNFIYETRRRRIERAIVFFSVSILSNLRTVLSEFGHHDFGSAPIREFHLSQRRAGRRTEENYYFPSTIVKL